MAIKFGNQSAESSEPKQFNEYLNISIEVAPGVLVRMPLNCAIPRDNKNLSKNQIILRDILLAKLDKGDLAIKVPIHGELYRRDTAEVEGSETWTA